MKLDLVRMSRNTKLGLLVCLLGLIAAFAGSPYKGTRVHSGATDLAGIVQREVDHVNPTDLADWIVKGRSDYRLIDLRTQAEFDQYHIPSAENVPLAALPDYGLSRNQRIILYSKAESIQHSLVFAESYGYKSVYMLRGGLDDWKDLVLFPPCRRIQIRNRLQCSPKMKEVSKYFGGTPRTASGAATPDFLYALPKLQMPGSPPPPAAPRKRRRC